MTEFEFFFAFYGLLLGLAVSELLNALGGVVRAGRVRSLGPRTALTGVLILVLLVATWLDAWNSLQAVRLDLANLAAPLLIALLYYLAAVIVFPKDLGAWASVDDYFEQRRRGLFVLLLIAELLVLSTFADEFGEMARTNPDRFWRWIVPSNIVTEAAFVAMIVVRNRRVHVVLLAGLILMFVAPYWDLRSVGDFFSGG